MQGSRPVASPAPSDPAADVTAAAPNRSREIKARQRRRRQLIRLTQTGVFVAVLVLWWASDRFGWGPQEFIGSPSGVWHYLREASGNGELWTNVKATMSATLLAFAIASAAGIVAGIGLGLLPTVDEVLDPFLTAINGTPRIALAPLFILIFGITQEAKVVLAVSIVFFIVLIASRAGVRAVDDDAMRVVLAYGGTKRQVFTKVLVPFAIPSIFAGLRLGIVYSLLGVITSEFIAAREGVGQLIVRYSNSYQVDAVYALILVLVFIAMVLNAVTGTIERHLLRWRPESGER
jgi:NitT/TauT family transport system permease protein